jgi:hypothetical protein
MCDCGADHGDGLALDLIGLAGLDAQATMAEAASTAFANAQLANVRGAFASEWHAAAGVFRGKTARIRAGFDPTTGAKLATAAARQDALRAAVSDLERRWQTTITRHFQASWKLGFAARGKLPPETTLGIQTLSPRFKAMVEGQHAAAARFAQDMAEGVPNMPGRQPYATRAQAYANATGAAFNLGAVDGGPPGELIVWVLGNADHCAECPLLAAYGPYTRETLPTVPRAGATPCRSNCKCSLVFKPGKAPERPAVDPDSVATAALNDPPQAPIGWRSPTPSERDTLRDLESRLNFARRQIASHPPDSAAQRQWIKTRRALNQELIDLTERERIYHVPTFSVSEVVNGAEVGGAAVTDLVVARGVDGETVAVAREAAAGAADEAMEQLATRLANLPPARPALPGAAALRRALAPPEAPPEGDGQGEAEAPICGCGAHMHRCRCPLAWSCPACGAHGLEQSRALEADAEPELPSSAQLPDPFGWQTVSVVGLGARHTAALAKPLLTVLATAEQPFQVELGPVDADWATLALELGFWVRGPGAEVQRLLTAWNAAAPAPGLGIAPYLS